jgi:MFS family permease
VGRADLDEEQRHGVRPGAFVGGSIAGFAVSWNLTNTGAIAPVLAHHYDVGLVTVGLLTSIAFFAEFAIMIPGGRAIDRWGARRVALVAIFVCLVGNALLLAVPGIYAALLLRWLLGFGIGAGFIAGSIWITEDARGRSALGQGLFGGISLAAAGIALAVVPALNGALGWQSSYWTGLVVAAAMLAIAFGCAGAVRTTGGHETTPLRHLMRNPLIARLGVVHTASFAFSVIAGNWVVTLLIRHLGLSYGAAGLAGALTLVLGIVGRPIGGWTVRRFPELGYVVIVGSLVLGALAMLALSLSSSLAPDVVAAAALGLASGVPFGACVNAAARSFPRAPGEAVGAMNLYAVTAIILGAPLVGATFSLPGGGRVGFAALAVLAVLSVAAVPATAFGGAPRNRPKRSEVLPKPLGE